MDPGIPIKQRKLVDEQLENMYQGEAPNHFRVLTDVFAQIKSSSFPVRVLDAGCASGYYSEILRHLVTLPLNYIGSDYNQAMLTMARQRYPDLPLFRMDLQKMAWFDRSFDIVLSGAVIVHIREWEKALSEIARISKKWIILHRTRVCLQNRTLIREERHYDVAVYRVSIGEKELLSLVEKLGFHLAHKHDCYEGDLEEGIGNFTYLFSRKEY